MTRDQQIKWLSDVSPADWIAPRLHPFLADTGSVVPEGFEAYCRIFHPLRKHRPPAASRTWAELAAENGRIVHPEMQLHMISHPVGARPEVYNLGDYINELDWGSVPLPERAELVDVLSSETTTPDQCWFCVWDGYGGLEAGSAGRVRHPHRDYLLYTGPIDLAFAELDLRPEQSPNLWWPDDRAWIVVTEIDYAWTYVGGSTGLIDRLLTNDVLEVLPTKLTDSPFVDGDVVNARLDED
jgi:hypothetical protein